MYIRKKVYALSNHISSGADRQEGRGRVVAWLDGDSIYSQSLDLAEIRPPPTCIRLLVETALEHLKSLLQMPMLDTAVPTSTVANRPYSSIKEKMESRDL